MLFHSPLLAPSIAVSTLIADKSRHSDRRDYHRCDGRRVGVGKDVINLFAKPVISRLVWDDVLVRVGVGVLVRVGVAVDVRVRVGVLVRVGVGVLVRVGVGLAGVLVRVGVGVLV